MPDGSAVLVLILSTMAALDHANITGNYTVLRDLGAPGFRDANDASRLSQIFANVRAQQLELSRLFLSSPQLAEPPAIDRRGLLRMKGHFPVQPQHITFEMLHEWNGERWRLFGISVGASPPLAPAARAPSALQKGTTAAPSPARK